MGDPENSKIAFVLNLNCQVPVTEFHDKAQAARGQAKAVDNRGTRHGGRKLRPLADRQGSNSGPETTENALIRASNVDDSLWNKSAHCM